MSLPSIGKIAEEKGVNLSNATPEQEEAILVEAMKCDLPLAVKRLHELAHELRDNHCNEVANRTFVELVEDPKSKLGGQLIRICASDACRPLASKHFCHGLQISFANCCNVRLGEPPKNLRLWQIQCQAGPIAFVDC